MRWDHNENLQRRMMMLINLTVLHNKAALYVSTKRIESFGPSETKTGAWVRVGGEDFHVVETPEQILSMVPQHEW